MQVIPVIDIKEDVCVRAVAGRRDQYRPTSSPLSASAAAPDVVSAYLGLYPFSSLYVADLDAIEDNLPNLEILDALHDDHSALSLWVDGGFASPDQLERLAGRPWLHPVIGSESQRSYADFERIMIALPEFGLGSPRLSLDFNVKGFMGPGEIVQHAQAWPNDLIVMTLDRVGLNGGPDLSRVQGIAAVARSAAPNTAHRIFAAGGVRGPTDLKALKDLGCAGVLVASALHDGLLEASHIAEAAR